MFEAFQGIYGSWKSYTYVGPKNFYEHFSCIDLLESCIYEIFVSKLHVCLPNLQNIEDFSYSC